jgi:hypothetical protein
MPGYDLKTRETNAMVEAANGLGLWSTEGNRLSSHRPRTLCSSTVHTKCTFSKSKDSASSATGAEVVDRGGGTALYTISDASSLGLGSRLLPSAYSQITSRCLHLVHSGLRRSQRTLDLEQFLHDFLRGGGVLAGISDSAGRYHGLGHATHLDQQQAIKVRTENRGEMELVQVFELRSSATGANRAVGGDMPKGKVRRGILSSLTNPSSTRRLSSFS